MEWRSFIGSSGAVGAGYGMAADFAKPTSGAGALGVVLARGCDLAVVVETIRAFDGVAVDAAGAASLAATEDLVPDRLTQQPVMHTGRGIRCDGV
jgi:hypothetical protein